MDALGFFLASTLIDLDHFAWFAWRFKSLDIAEAKRMFENHELREYPVLKAFHTIEFWLIMIVLGMLGGVWFFLLLGASFHLAIDAVQIVLYERKHPEIKKALRSWSIIGFAFKSANQWK